MKKAILYNKQKWIVLFSLKTSILLIIFKYFIYLFFFNKTILPFSNIAETIDYSVYFLIIFNLNRKSYNVDFIVFGVDDDVFIKRSARDRHDDANANHRCHEL